MPQILSLWWILWSSYLSLNNFALLCEETRGVVLKGKWHHCLHLGFEWLGWMDIITLLLKEIFLWTKQKFGFFASCHPSSDKFSGPRPYFICHSKTGGVHFRAKFPSLNKIPLIAKSNHFLYFETKEQWLFLTEMINYWNLDPLAWLRVIYEQITLIFFFLDYWIRVILLNGKIRVW